MSVISEYFRRYRKKKDGVVAIEFALLAAPFLTLMLGIFEIGMLLTTSFVLEGGTVEAARLVRTGEAIDSGDPEGTFVARLCDQVDSLIDCNEISYEAVPMGAGGFSSAEGYSSSFDGDGNMVSAGFAAGTSDEVVLIRTFHRYNFFVPMIGTIMTGEVGGGSITLMSTAIIRNEPYDFGG